jgi:hypothetical protein
MAGASGLPATVGWAYRAAVAAVLTVLACATLALAAAVHGRRGHRHVICTVCGSSTASSSLLVPITATLRSAPRERQ